MRSLIVILVLVALFSSLVSLARSSSQESAMAMPRQPATIDRERVGVLLIDAQPSFVNSMHGDATAVVERVEQLVVHANWWKLPVLATFEHDPERNGWLPESVERVFPEDGLRLVKRRFNCCSEDDIRGALTEMQGKVDQLVVAGAETDVCVLQSVLGAIEMGFQVFLLEDVLFSNEQNVGPALDRMYNAGAVPSTYKTFYYEMMRSVDSAEVLEQWGTPPQELRSVMKSPYALAPSRPLR
jgi:nicotinamidase-related amidase